MVLTEELLEDGKSRNGGWSYKQLSLFGVKWPLKKGWKQKIVGRNFNEDVIERFLARKDQHLEPLDDSMDAHLRSISRQI